MDPIRRAFLDDIAREPDADDLRLIYSDWLEDNAGGEADASYGKFVRAHVECARLAAAVEGSHGPGLLKCLRDTCDVCPDYATRREEAQDLFDKHAVSWLGLANSAVRPPRMDLDYERGFLGKLHVDEATWFAHGPRLVDEQPLLGHVSPPCLQRVPRSAWTRGGGGTFNISIMWGPAELEYNTLGPGALLMALADKARAYWPGAYERQGDTVTVVHLPVREDEGEGDRRIGTLEELRELCSDVWLGWARERSKRGAERD